MKWIINSKADLLLIIFPWVLFLPFLFWITQRSSIPIIMSILILGFLDSGHVYTTFWRLVWTKDTRKKYFLLILGIFLVMAIWLYFQIPYFWSMIVYFTLYHHLRQYFGMMKWYELKNKSFSKIRIYFFYVVSILCLIGFHFRNVSGSYYTGDEIFYYPNALLLLLTQIVVSLLFIAYIAFEAKNKKLKTSVFLATVSPMLMYMVVLFFPLNATEVVFLFVIAHTIPYLTIMSEALLKVRHLSLVVAAIIVCVTAAVFGVTEITFGDFFYDFGFYYMVAQLSLTNVVLLALFMTPLITHFIFDAIVWRKKHPDSKDIYK